MTDTQAAVARVDAHQQFWGLASGRYDRPTETEGPIFRSFGPADLAPELRSADVGLVAFGRSAAATGSA